MSRRKTIDFDQELAEELAKIRAWSGARCWPDIERRPTDLLLQNAQSVGQILAYWIRKKHLPRQRLYMAACPDGTVCLSAYTSQGGCVEIFVETPFPLSDAALAMLCKIGFRINGTGTKKVGCIIFAEEDGRIFVNFYARAPSDLFSDRTAKILCRPEGIYDVSLYGSHSRTSEQTFIDRDVFIPGDELRMFTWTNRFIRFWRTEDIKKIPYETSPLARHSTQGQNHDSDHA